MLHSIQKSALMQIASATSIARCELHLAASPSRLASHPFISLHRSYSGSCINSSPHCFSFPSSFHTSLHTQYASTASFTSSSTCQIHPQRAPHISRRYSTFALTIASSLRCTPPTSSVAPQHVARMSTAATVASPATGNSATPSSSAPPSSSSVVYGQPAYDAPLPTLAPVDTIDPSEITIDPSVTHRLTQLSAKHAGAQSIALRVLVDQGGCSGLEYKFTVEVDQQPPEEDIVLRVSPIASVVIDRDSWLWLRGSRIVYTNDLARAAFVVDENPNAVQACGCKSSFAPKTTAAAH